MRLTLEKIIEAHDRLRSIPKEEQLTRMYEIIAINREIVLLGHDLSTNVPYVFTPKSFEDTFLIFRASDGTVTVQIANMISNDEPNPYENLISRGSADDSRSQLPPRATA